MPVVQNKPSLSPPFHPPPPLTDALQAAAAAPEPSQEAPWEEAAEEVGGQRQGRALPQHPPLMPGCLLPFPAHPSSAF